MIVIIDLSEVISVAKPQSRTEYTNLLDIVEHMLSSYYAIPAVSTQFNPLRFRINNIDHLIHHKLAQVLPVLRAMAHKYQILYIDLGVNGSLIVSSEKIPHDHYRIYSNALP